MNSLMSKDLWRTITTNTSNNDLTLTLILWSTFDGTIITLIGTTAY